MEERGIKGRNREGKKGNIKEKKSTKSIPAGVLFGYRWKCL